MTSPNRSWRSDMGTTVRTLMGVKGWTMSDRGMTSYCMTDGKEHVTKEIYETVERNLTKKLGDPHYVDGTKAKYWFVNNMGLIILPSFMECPFQYVEFDKNSTKQYFDEFIKEDKEKQKRKAQLKFPVS
jgi:hypothetical protein